MGLGVTMYQVRFWFKFTLTFTSAFLSIITGTFYARKLKFCMLLTQPEAFNSVLELPLGHALSGAWGPKGGIIYVLWTRLVRSSFLKVHISTTAYQKTLIFHHRYPRGLAYIPCYRSQGLFLGVGLKVNI